MTTDETKITGKIRKIYNEWFVFAWRDHENLNDRRGPFDSFAEAEDFRDEQSWLEER